MIILRTIMLVIAVLLYAFIGFDLWLMQVQPVDNATWDFLALVPMVSCAIACTMHGVMER